ncbi:tail fiber domain-containing protein [Chromobacterium phragmitis]|uniref:Tail fiber domain-containing protein n=1 Tax=Chromobacterium phragmitis TaxID=2202141 RepID=A0ABV0J0J7_9NEIS
MQKFTPLQPSDKIADSRAVINDALSTLASNFSGNAFPTSNLTEGMLCYRADQKKLYFLDDLASQSWKVALDFRELAGDTPAYRGFTNLNANNKPRDWPLGMSFGSCYNNGYPINLGVVMTIKEARSSVVQILIGWPGSDKGESRFMTRAARDVGANEFGPWLEPWSRLTFDPNSKVDKASNKRPGVTRLYRRDDDTPYNVQTNWDGKYWVLSGYNEDTFHAGVRVATADSLAGRALVDVNSSIYKDRVPFIGGDGVMEIGSSLDFHEGDGDGKDFAARLYSDGGRLFTKNQLVLGGAFGGSKDGPSHLEVRALDGQGGDGNLASIALHVPGLYATRISLRGDGYMGFGGWSADLWRWHVHLPTGNMYAAGDITAFSDRRLKKDFERIANALDKCDQIAGWTYTRKDTGRRQAGVIAQDLQKVQPELVSEAQDGTLSVAYGNMCALLLEAIKELRQEVNEIKAQLKECAA